MIDKVQVDKHELLALLERVLFTTKDQQAHSMARQLLFKYTCPQLSRSYQPTHSNLGEPPQDE